jgi:LmbE family N-acetylglucosaminyl deacetylase
MDLGYHMDHQCSARIALAAHTNAGLWRLWPESGVAWKIEEFYMWQFQQPRFYVDISAVIETKVDAFLAHESQLPSVKEVTGLIKELGARVANATWSKTPIEYAEGFQPYF